MLIRRRNGSHPSSFVKGRLRSRVVHGSCGRFGFGSVSCRFCAWLWCSRSNFAASPRGSETTSSTFVRDKLNSLTQLIPGQLPIQGRYASAPASPGFRKSKRMIESEKEPRIAPGLLTRHRKNLLLLGRLFGQLLANLTVSAAWNIRLVECR